MVDLSGRHWYNSICVCQGQLDSEMVISCWIGVMLEMGNKTIFLSIFLNVCWNYRMKSAPLVERKWKQFNHINAMPLKRHPNNSWVMKTFLKRYDGFYNSHKGKKVKLTLSWPFCRYCHINVFLDFLVEGSFLVCFLFFFIKEMIGT